MKKIPDHIVRLDHDEIYAPLQRKWGKIDVTENIRDLLKKAGREVPEEKRPSDINSWSHLHWIAFAREINYTHQNAKPGYEENSYRVITGKYFNGESSLNPIPDMSVEEVEANESIRKLVAAVVAGIKKYAVDNKIPIK